MSLLFGYASDLEVVQEDVDMDGNRIVDLPEPTTDSEPITKGYADKNYLGGGAQGPCRDKGDPRPKEDKGDVGLSGPRELQGPQGLTGPRGRKSDKGDQGPQGPQGTGGLTDAGFTMKVDINMGGNEVVGLPATPSAGSASVSKSYTESRYVRKNLDINMNDHKITNLEAPTTNTDAATKKYVDDKKCKFKAVTITSSDVDLRASASGSKFYDDVTFKTNAKCKDLYVISSSDAIVNKNSLETGRLVGIQSLSSTVRGLLANSAKHELLIMKGNPKSSTIITRHHSLNGNPRVGSSKVIVVRYCSKLQF